MHRETIRELVKVGYPCGRAGLVDSTPVKTARPRPAHARGSDEVDKRWFKSILVGLVVTMAALQAGAAEFKAPAECVVGKRVVTRQNQAGKIVKVDRTMCSVLLDSGEERTTLFWMLRAEGASSDTDDQLVSGVYQCYAGNPTQYTFTDLKILGAFSYEWAGKRGRFKILASKGIEFQSGPLQGYGSKLLDGPSIGLNADGGSSYATRCSLKK